MLDSLTTDESILLAGSLNIEAQNQDDNLIGPFVSSYLVIPSPTNGTGSYLVTDGGPRDYDGVLNGQVSVFPVPLGTYRINQTSSPAGGWSSLINFTYATVHLDNINSTALFRSVLDPADIPQLQENSDIITWTAIGY